MCISKVSKQVYDPNTVLVETLEEKIFDLNIQEVKKKKKRIQPKLERERAATVAGSWYGSILYWELKMAAFLKIWHNS